MTDHFARLGLPRRLDIDPDQLQQAYLAHARQSHPDYQSGAVDLVGVQATAAEVNDAHATLRDPLRRAGHLLTLLGAPPPGSTPQAVEFLFDVMAARERLELGEAGAVLDELLERESVEFQALRLNLAADSPSLAEARAGLDRLKTLASLRREAHALKNRPDA